MTAREHKVNSYTNLVHDRIAGNSLAAIPGMLLTKTGAYATKAAAGSLVLGICLDSYDFASDNQSVGQERVIYRPTDSHDQYIMKVKSGQTPLITHVGSYFEIDVDGTTGEQTVDLTTSASTTPQLEVVGIIGSSDNVIVQFIEVRSTGGGGGGGLSDGDYGDITVSGGGTGITIDDEAVTLAKMAHVSSSVILGRVTSGTGDVEALNASQVRTIINVEDGADVTDATNVEATGAVMDSDFTSNGLMQRTSAGAYTTIAIGTSAGNIPQLDGSGKLSSSVMPSLAISEYLGAFADLTAALADSGVQASQRGDWFTTGGNATYIVISDSPTLSGHVQEMYTPTGAVASVNGYTGAVVLDPDDLDDTATTNKFVTATQKSNWDTAYGWGNHASAGYATKVGTPVNNQLAVRTGDGTLEGEANLTYSTGVFTIAADLSIDGNINQNGNLVLELSSGNQNYAQIIGSSTGNAVQFAVAGGDTNINTNIKSKGSGVVQANGVEVVTLSGTQNLSGKTLGDTRIESLKHVYFQTISDNGNSGAADTIDRGQGNIQESTLTGNCTYTFTDPDGPGNYQLILVQDGTGGRTVTWPAEVKWPGGTAPTLTTDAGAIDIISFIYDGASYYAVDVLDLS